MKLLKENGKLGVLTWKHSECAMIGVPKVEKVRANAPIFDGCKKITKVDDENIREKERQRDNDDDENAWAEMNDCKRPTGLKCAHFSITIGYFAS